jgi:hypothetical protein
MITPVPFGTQTARLSARRTDTPLERTRVAATVHCAVTHGIGPAAVLNGQPVIAYGPDKVVIGWPPTLWLL